jgi:hypothetical protein
MLRNDPVRLIQVDETADFSRSQRDVALGTNLIFDRRTAPRCRSMPGSRIGCLASRPQFDPQPVISPPGANARPHFTIDRQPMDSPLIDRIYESCFAPEIWPDVLDELGQIAGAPGASLFVSKGDALHCVASPEPRQRAERIVKEGWLWRGTIVGRLFAQRYAGFLIDVEYFTPEELDREPIYRDV